LRERSIDAVAGGVSRNLDYHIPYPVLNELGTGARLIDVDGNTSESTSYPAASCSNSRNHSDSRSATLSGARSANQMVKLSCNSSIVRLCDSAAAAAN
jgi:hypothetical protein